MADELTAAGKYFLISVPDFANDPVGEKIEPGAEKEESDEFEKTYRRGEPMTSFLRMGSFHENAMNAGGAVQRSYELAEKAKVVSTSQGGPPTLPFGAEIDNLTDVGINGRGVFLADQRTKHPEDGTIPVKDRLEQSAALLSRGGWWDHSDGNRISTTYGDKVEVIRGNFKMVVMHRQDDPASSGGWDVSGGHIQDLGPASMPGASVRLEFRPGTFGQKGGLGTWHLENTTNNFNQTSDFAGDFYEHWYGDHKESTTGSEHPEPFSEKFEKPYGNPAIIEKTWASKIEGYTGSSNWRIPTIQEETYAVLTTAVTDVSVAITETTYCDGTITSKTGSAIRRVPAMFEETYAVATNTKTDVGNSNDLTIVGAAMETTIAGALGSVTIAGVQLDAEIVGVKGTVSIIPLLGEFSLGTRFACTIGFSREVSIGNHDTLDIPDKKDIALTRLNAELETMHATLSNSTVSVEEKITSLSVGIAGIQVQLGL